MELMIFHTQNFSNPTQMLGQRQMMDEVKVSFFFSYVGFCEGL